MGVNKVALILLIANLIVAYVSGIVVYSKSNLQLKKRSRPARYKEAKDLQPIVEPFNFKNSDRKNVFDALNKKTNFFQDIIFEQSAPNVIQFGHVCENPTEWEQRFEQKDFGTNRHSGKVRWGNENGNYGEHYWDLNHAR